tara:strand:- start:497 stop:1771 length:1275 start_codon:yes stop_codon:yes gene_type:complete
MVTAFKPKKYKPLKLDEIKKFITSNKKLFKLFKKNSNLQVKEVGDGNLNLVFFIENKYNSICVKQPLPYLRVLKDWPLTLKRSYYEHQYFKIHSKYVKNHFPQIYDYDEVLCSITMEKLSPHIIMRHGLIKAIKYNSFANSISTYLAKTLFFTSDLHLSAAAKKNLILKFLPNTELCKITEDLIFTDPYRVNKNNRWTKPYLNKLKKKIENDTLLKIAISRMKLKFMKNTDALLHGDLHTGSIMVTKKDTKVIDPEFAFFGPMGFDIGALIANLLMSYFSQVGHEKIQGERKLYKIWLLELIQKIWIEFEKKFLKLWEKKNYGDAYPRVLFKNDIKKFNKEKENYMRKLFQETVSFAGAKIIRRIFGFAHNIDFDWIENEEVRANCEYKASQLAILMLTKTNLFKSITDLTNEASKREKMKVIF